ncbi:MAG: hypothetical protein COA29_00740 [Porticoccus sp.]|jgi:hypothetical protein|nr:MAG: hypothetical protein COA29_00740 [Porticoccus sp.]
MSKLYEKRQSSYKTIQQGNQGLKQQNWPVCRIIPQSDGQSATVSHTVESQKQSNNDDRKQVSSQ